MADKSKLYDVIMKRYDFEHDKKEKINTRIQYLTTLFIAVCGIGAFIIQRTQDITTCEFKSVAIVVGIAILLIFIFATYNAFLVLRGYTYSYLPSAEDTVAHMKDYEVAISGDDYADVRDEYYNEELHSVIIEFAKKCADENSDINAVRSVALSRAITYYSVSGVMAIILIGSIMLFAAKSKPSDDKDISCFCQKHRVYSSDTLSIPVKLDLQTKKIDTIERSIK